MNNIAIFASGNGSNFQAIVDSVKAGKLQANVSCLICDKSQAKVIDRAKKSDIPVYVVTPTAYDSKHDYEQAILKILKDYHIDFLVLAGYMRLVGDTLLNPYSHRIINIHPSLLPEFPGLHAIEKAYEAGVHKTGVTIHYVDNGIDTGPIISQEAITINKDEPLESVEERIYRLEHQLYPEVLNKLFSSKEG